MRKLRTEEAGYQLDQSNEAISQFCINLKIIEKQYDEFIKENGLEGVGTVYDFLAENILTVNGNTKEIKQFTAGSIKRYSNTSLNGGSALSIRAALGISSLLNIDLQRFFFEEIDEDENIFSTTAKEEIIRYLKLKEIEMPLDMKPSNKSNDLVKIYNLLFIDTDEGIYLQNAKLKIFGFENKKQKTYRVEFEIEQKVYKNITYYGVLTNSDDFKTFSIDLFNKRRQKIEIFLYKPNALSTNILATWGFMLSFSADGEKQPTFSKCLLIDNKHLEEINEEWLLNMLRIHKKAIYVSKDDFDEAVGNIDKKTSAALRLDINTHFYKINIQNYIEEAIYLKQKKAFREKEIAEIELLSIIQELIERAELPAFMKLNNTDNQILMDKIFE